MGGRSFAVTMLAVLCQVAQSHAGFPCPPDLDQSGDVTGIDLALLLGDWGPCDPCTQCSPDLDFSGSVDGFDLATLLSAWGVCVPPGPPAITYTLIAHEGDPAPGIDFPGVVYDILGTPQIDEVGDVLFWSAMFAPGLPSSTDAAIFHGPPGKVLPILREGDQAPGLPPGVIIKSLVFVQYRLCESGQVVTTAQLGGPGIIPGLNDYALFIGNPRKDQPLTKLLQLGEPAPGEATNPELSGLVLGSDGGSFFGADQSDNGTLALFALLKGPGISPDTYHKAAWTGPPDDLRLVYRDGMPAPGLPSGVTFAWLDLPSISDLGQLAFRGLVQGPGITDDNDMGRWIGGPGSLQVVSWTGLPAPQMPAGVTYLTAGGGLTCTNIAGDMYANALIAGPGVDSTNDHALFAGSPSSETLILQEGDVTLEAGPDVEIDSIGNLYINNERELWYRVRYRGPGIDETNKWAMYFGPIDNPQLALRDGEPAPTFPRDIVLSRVVAASSLSALNDIGDLATVTEIAGPGVTTADKVVLWMRDASYGGWYPLLRGNQTIGSHVASIPTTAALSGAFWQLTGGADGYGLSFNDQRQLAMKIEFSDGTHGLYVIEPGP